MPIAHLQGNGAALTTVQTIPVTLGATVGQGNTVMGFLLMRSLTIANLTSITDDKNNTYTIVDQLASGSLNATLFSFYLPNITNRPITISGNLSVAHSCVIAVDEYSGIRLAPVVLDGHTMQDQTAPGTGADGCTSGNLTTATNGALIYGGCANATAGSQVITKGTNFNIRQTVVTGNYLITEDLIQGTAGAIAAAATIASNVEVITGVMAFMALGGIVARSRRGRIGSVRGAPGQGGRVA